MSKKTRHDFDLLSNIRITEISGGITHEESVKINFDVLVYRLNKKDFNVNKNTIKTEVAELSSEDIKYLIKINDWGKTILDLLEKVLMEKNIKK